MILDITTTAMARPDIVERTYKSFTSQIKNVDWQNSTAYINIDPLPEGIDRNEVVKVVRKYVGHVHAFMPEEANYSAAYKRIWESAKERYVLNLEDDFELTEPVDIRKLLNKLQGMVVCAAMRLYPYSYKNCPTSPALWKTDFLKIVAARLTDRLNPETQLHDIIKLWYIKQYHSVDVYPDKRCIVKDIGRDWMKTSGYMSPREFPKDDERYAKKCFFTNWIKK